MVCTSLFSADLSLGIKLHLFSISVRHNVPWHNAKLFTNIIPPICIPVTVASIVLWLFSRNTNPFWPTNPANWSNLRHDVRQNVQSYPTCQHQLRPLMMTKPGINRPISISQPCILTNAAPPHPPIVSKVKWMPYRNSISGAWVYQSYPVIARHRYRRYFGNRYRCLSYDIPSEWLCSPKISAFKTRRG